MAVKELQSGGRAVHAPISWWAMTKEGFQGGHSDAVFCVEFSEPYMFTGGDDGVIVKV